MILRSIHRGAKTKNSQVATLRLQHRYNNISSHFSTALLLVNTDKNKQDNRHSKSSAPKNRCNMALECLAILGIKNEPLYLKTTRSAKQAPDADIPGDAFGFVESESAGTNLSIRQEVSFES